jgi:hypothetical protein
MAGQDIFGRTPPSIKTPITADRCIITWDNKTVTQAIQFQMSYGQSVTRRRTIGSNDAVVYGSQPSGQATMARLYVSGDSAALFSTDSWTCGGTGIVTFATGACDSQQGPTASGGNAGGDTFTARGCMVSQFSISAQAEDLTVVDNVTIEFLQLERA